MWHNLPIELNYMPTIRRFFVVAMGSMLLGTMVFLGITRLKSHTIRRYIIKRSRQVSKLVELPTEILVEILLLLELKDILHIRQTSQRLRDATLARPVWLSLVQWYFATIKPRPFIPDKPLNLYTSRELEELIIKWQRSKVRWTLEQPRIRSFSFPKDYFDCTHLIEGGRWLIFATRYGSVKYKDLNNLDDDPDAVILIPSLFDEEIIIDTRLSIDMDPDAQYLTFNLGLMMSPQYENEHPDFPNLPRFAYWIQVFHITPNIDETGQVTGLRADCLARFREPYLSGCDSFTLQGRHVAYSMHTFERAYSFNDGRSIAIVDWSLVDSTSLAYPRRLLCRIRAKWLALLSDNQLLCHSQGDFLLFDLSAIPVTTVPPTQQGQPPRQLPMARLCLHVYNISQPYVVHHCTRFCLITDSGVKGLIIDRSSGGMDCVELLSDDSLCISKSHVGYDHAVASWWPEFTAVQYAWPEVSEAAHSAISPKSTARMLDTGTKVVFDESSGRVVIYGYQSTNKCLDLGMMEL